MKRLLQIFFPLAGVVLLGYILSVSIGNNGGIAETFNSSDKQVLFYNLFKLAGLTAFTLLSYQIITGPFMRLWEKIYGDRFYLFHAWQGIFVLVFAVTHWILIHVYMSFSNLSIPEFDALYEKPFIYFGPIALILIFVTVVTAVLTVLLKWTKLEKIWWVHWINYIVFFMIFSHSLKIGSDIAYAESPLRPIWYAFFVVAVTGLLYRRVYVAFLKQTDEKSSLAGEGESYNKIV